MRLRATSSAIGIGSMAASSRAMGIRDKPTAPASPWQNGFVERLIGSIRRECVDHIIVLCEAHLRRVLKSYAHYSNGVSLSRGTAHRCHSFTPSLADFITIMLGFKVFGTHTASHLWALRASPNLPNRLMTSARESAEVGARRSSVY